MDVRGDHLPTHRVTGIGGVFFRSTDPARIARWYAEHLGVSLTPYDETPMWHQTAGPTVFEPFPADTAYFGSSANAFMLNFRVDDLAAIVDQLSAAGIEVFDRVDDGNGRFAHLTDPEGRRVELWEPAPGVV